MKEQIKDLETARDVLIKSMKDKDVNYYKEAVSLLQDIMDELKNENERPNECDLLINRVIELIGNSDYCDMECPLCEENHIKHINYNNTQIYVCEDCSFVALEFVEDKDIENLEEYLKLEEYSEEDR